MTISKSHRLLTTLLLSGALASPIAHAATGGQMLIRLTIADACEVQSDQNATSLTVQASHCDAAADYRVRYENKGLRMDQEASAKTITRIQADDGSKLVTLYW